MPPPRLSPPPFLPAVIAALLLYDPNGHHAPSNAACCCLSPASSSFSQFLLGFFRSPSPGTRRLSCKQKSLSCSRYTSLQTAIHGKPPCHRVTRRFSSEARRMPCAYAPCPSAPTDLDAASGPAMQIRTAPAIHIRKDFVQSPRRRVHPNPPVPSSTMPLAAADRAYALLSPRLVSDAHTDHREATTFLGELGGLGTGGDAIHPRRAWNLWLYSARARILRVALTGGLRVRRQPREDILRGVVFADRLGPGTRLERH
ncbi:hypothetical protein B0H14DRAFT_3490937 [Mycena olivaceomarginata]|nr:hypothetical protein B0H14DRAFT_3490937 [Mycena olivaceomarginata]